MKNRNEAVISFVILHYGDLSVTEQCVRSILEMDQQENIRIVVMDNDVDRPETERQKLSEKYQGMERLQVLRVEENGGFSYANNLGYRYAREVQNAGFIIVANNDIEFPQKDFPQRLYESYEKQRAHVLGPDIIRQGTGEHQNPLDTRLRTKEETRRTIRSNRLGLRLYPVLFPLLSFQMRRMERQQTTVRLAQSERYAKTQTQIIPFGACLIFTPAFIKQEKKAFAPETRFFYEEYLLARRCREKAYRIVYDPSMRVFHESGTATKRSYRNEYRRLRFVMERTVEACEIYLVQKGIPENSDTRESNI
ncbi:MAG: glycosyltransferase [Eubacteriales bacterium]|nr:glycosyltransferase [Eubacteriales bacterium]